MHPLPSDLSTTPFLITWTFEVTIQSLSDFFFSGVFLRSFAALGLQSLLVKLNLAGEFGS